MPGRETLFPLLIYPHFIHDGNLKKYKEPPGLLNFLYVIHERNLEEDEISPL